MYTHICNLIFEFLQFTSNRVVKYNKWEELDVIINSIYIFINLEFPIYGDVSAVIHIRKAGKMERLYLRVIQIVSNKRLTL